MQYFDIIPAVRVIYWLGNIPNIAGWQRALFAGNIAHFSQRITCLDITLRWFVSRDDNDGVNEENGATSVTERNGKCARFANMDNENNKEW